MVFNEQQFLEIAQLLNQSKKIAITTHRNPDGDAIGSTMALSAFLRDYCSAEICVVLPDPRPYYLNFLTKQHNFADFKTDFDHFCFFVFQNVCHAFTTGAEI